jgi:hypothetical protein
MHTGVRSVSVLVLMCQHRYAGFCTVRVYIRVLDGTDFCRAATLAAYEFVNGSRHGILPDGLFKLGGINDPRNFHSSAQRSLQSRFWPNV